MVIHRSNSSTQRLFVRLFVLSCLVCSGPIARAASLTSEGNQLWFQNSTGISGASETWDEFGRVLATGDFNGDGAADLAIGVPLEDIGDRNDAGVVQVIYGSNGGGLTAQADQVWSQNNFGDPWGSAQWNEFGHSLAVGDFNGDGFDDLAIGVPGQDLADAWNELGVYPHWCERGVKENPDVYCSAGMVHVLYGSSESGLSWKVDISDWWPDPYFLVEAKYDSWGAYWGAALAAGDFNGDGFDDLAIGAPQADDYDYYAPSKSSADIGQVYVAWGTDSGIFRWEELDAPGSYSRRLLRDGATLSGESFLGLEKMDHFGSVLVAGDFDGDGRSELAAGLPDKDHGICNFGGVCDAGAVAIIDFGDELKTDTTPPNDIVYDPTFRIFHQNSSGVNGVVEEDDRFGFSLASGDFDGDGRDDLAIGIPYEDLGSCGIFGERACRDGGGVYVMYGTNGGLSTSGDQWWDQNSSGIKGATEDDDKFGWSLAAGDFDNDGRDDLAIGIPFEYLGACGLFTSCLREAGAVTVLYSNSGGLSARDQLWTQNSSGLSGGAEDWDQFGWALAAGDFNGDGQFDLAIGSPKEDVGSIDNAGAVNVLYGHGAPTNAEPVAADDAYDTNEDTPLVVGPGAGLLNNDTDAEGDPLAVHNPSLLAVANGTLSVTADGSFTYTPNADYCGQESFTYQATDSKDESDPASVTITVHCVNDPPSITALPDEFSVEDSGAHTVNPFAAASPGGGPDEAGQTFSYTVTQVTNSWLFDVAPSIAATGTLTYTLAPNANGTATITVTVTDSGGGDDTSAPDTFDLVVSAVNDPPQVVSVSPLNQFVDYSDHIAQVTVEVSDIDNAATTLSESNEPPLSAVGLSLGLSGCAVNYALSPNPLEAGSVCTWTYDGQILDPGINSHDVLFTASDSLVSGLVTRTHTLNIQPEGVTAWLFGDNPVSTEVIEEGTEQVDFSLAFFAEERDATYALPEAYGSMSSAEGYMILKPVGPGGTLVGGPCDKVGVNGSGYGQVAEFLCHFDSVPVNTYEVQAQVGGLTDEKTYYFGWSDEDVFVVFDSSLGFTTGGGWFYWPGTAAPEFEACGEEGYPGDKTNFAFSMNYNKKNKRAKGSMLLMRHTVDTECYDAGSYKVKSNVIEGMALGDGEDDQGRRYGWTAFSGKSVYSEPGLEGEGNHPFMAYAEDHGEVGCNQDPADEFWIEAKDRTGTVVLEVNGPDSDPTGESETEDGDDEPIECGNIVVPFGSGGGGQGKP